MVPIRPDVPPTVQTKLMAALSFRLPDNHRTALDKAALIKSGDLDIGNYRAFVCGIGDTGGL